MSNIKCVFRNFALPVATFDHLKQFQRSYQEKHLVTLNNSQTLAVMLRQHRQLMEQGLCHV